MSYFIFDGVLKCGKEYDLDKDEAKHLLKSRRFRSSDRFFIQDITGNRFEAVIIKCNKSQLTFIPDFSVITPPPSSLQLEILQAVTKEKAIDFIIQKSTELGVSRLDFFCGTFSPVSYRKLLKRNPFDRWKRIALEASKQCGRQFPPEIFCHENFSNALEKIRTCQQSWILTPGLEKSASWENDCKKSKKMYQRIIVGPEGGFHIDEIDFALKLGILPIDLGPRILRSETAAITAASILQFLCGDLKNSI